MGSSPTRRTEHKRIGGVPIALVTEEQIVSMMVEDCARYREGNLKKPVTVYDCNGQAMSLFATDPEFAEAMNSASMVHADGQFIVWVSRFLAGDPVPERTATTDLIHSAAKAAQLHKLRFYLLGATEQVNNSCAQELRKRYPGLEIVGRRNGYFTEAEEADLVADINHSKADVVWVGLGKPKEQAFAHRIQHRLDCAWIVTCGGCFHFVTGDYSRAPNWMQTAGLEWVHRMATGPRYLVGRYLLTIPHALGLVFYRDFIGRRWVHQEQTYRR